MTDKVYHFSDTAHLPMILESRKLIPHRDRVMSMPPTTFLWASTVARGEPDAPAVISRTLEWDHDWECGLLYLVRFTLRAEDFAPWTELITKYPRWTPEHVKLMHGHAISWGGSVDTWRCRTRSLPLARWLAVEIKPYCGRWQPYDYRNPDPEMIAAVRAHRSRQSDFARQPIFECPQCGDTARVVDDGIGNADDINDVRCSSCDWEGEREDCQ
jgi:predicted Zn finger-like uncharacterized protein